LTQIHGVVPSPADFPDGCRFADRCPAATEVCRTETPQLEGQGRHHSVACHHPALDISAPLSAAGAVADPPEGR
ncbi:MAG: oligopeptide/dipeptide transporter, ATPase subunit, partial [Actinoallomurus sp.]|nr:oligopeptide/dipeptide transporter, ATPase subunit [Actinoallomurus sp.]